MTYELSDYAYLDVFLEILVLRMLLDFFNEEAHFFGGSFDEVEKGLDIEIAHNFDVEYFIYKFDGLNLYVEMWGEIFGQFIFGEHSYELNKVICYPFCDDMFSIFFL